MNSYRNLAAEKIVGTLNELNARIGERFPRSGLLRVCQELTAMTEQTTERAAGIARPVLWLRALLAAVAISGAIAIYLLAGWVAQLRPSDELAGVMQGLEAAVNLVIIGGAAALFLVTLEARWKRRKALAALHEFRSIAHVIDMHQLTKDPSALGGPTHELLARARHDPLRAGALFRATARRCCRCRARRRRSMPTRSTIRPSSTPSATSSG